MSRLFIFALFFIVASFQVQALRRRALETSVMREEPPNDVDDSAGSFLETQADTFSVRQFYEHLCYSHGYFLFNDFTLNKAMKCTNSKKQFGFEKKLEAKSVGNFCKLMAKKYGGSYLPYITNYILDTGDLFKSCTV